MKIVIDPFDKKSISNAERMIRQYSREFDRKVKLLRERLATVGATLASIEFSRAIYNGTNDVSVRVADDGTKATIFAEGSAVAFIEFGSGDRYGHGHPMNGEFGTGPGTYPSGKGNWNKPGGWWYAHGQHTYGNPPAMAMVHARDAMVEQVTRIAREVFAGG